MRTRIKQLLAALSAITIVLIPILSINVSATPVVTEYTVDPGNNFGRGLYDITTGPDGALWFTEENTSEIGRITSSGNIAEYSTPSPPDSPAGITTGSDGALWFAEYSRNKLGRVTTNGETTEFSIPYDGNPWAIATGSDGALWFTEMSASGDAIGRITTTGVVNMYSLSVHNSAPLDITVGPDGALWFIEENNNTVGRISTTGDISYYAIPTPNSSPLGITAGPDGALWFTEYAGNKIGRITSSGSITEYTLPDSGTYPTKIATGSDGALWFTMQGNNNAGSIGRITISGDVSEYAIPTSSPAPSGITAGPDGALWFTEFGSNKIGRITTPPPVLSAPTSLTASTPTNTNPSLSWDTVSGANSYNIYRNGTKIDSSTTNSYTDNSAPEGTDSYYVTAVDSSGNESSPSNTVNVVADRTAPNVTGTPDSQPNSNGWYNHDATINWNATDSSPSSGTPTQPSPTLASTEGDHTYTSDQSCDPANNCATGSAELKIDTTNPDITYSVSPAANANDWNNSDVTVTFNCSDPLANPNDPTSASGIDTCTSPVTVNTEGSNQTVTGTATDKAGNTATVTANVGLDKTSPTITTSLSQQPNTNGWNNAPVTVSYACVDNAGGSGIQTCSDPQTESNDGSYTLSGVATDNADNMATVSNTINIDQTPPTVGMATWSANPAQVGNNTTLTVPTSDNLSGVVAGEYYVGTDPGVGNGTAMSYDGASGNLTAVFGSNLTPGVYTVGYRSKDAAGNWSSTSTTMLVVYDTNTTLSMTGKNKKDLTPTFANGDIMPGLIDPNQTDTADFGFTVQYKNGALDSHNDFVFNYTTGTNCNSQNASNCHSFNLNVTSFDWLVVNGTNNSQGEFQGTATVTVDGVTTTNPFTVNGIDGSRLTPATDNSLVLKVFAPGADPSSATPIYQASGIMSSNESVKIH